MRMAFRKTNRGTEKQTGILRAIKERRPQFRNTISAKSTWRALLSLMTRAAAVGGGVVILNPARPLLTSSAEANAEVAPESSKHLVSIEHYKYMPEVLTVPVGNTIEWKNGDDVPHTATSIQKGFHSGNLPTGGTWEFRATKPGEYFTIAPTTPI